MEAASLIIGNGNWGTKPSELLGYYVENGNQYRPLIGDVSRSSTKMVTNKDGLLEKVNPNIASIDYSDDVKGSLLLEPQSTNLITQSESFGNSYWTKSGASIEGDPSTAGVEQVTNGDFATDTDWNKGTGVTINNGKANWNSAPNNNGITQSGLFTIGKFYKVEFTLSNYVSGLLRIRFPVITEDISSNGTYIYYVEATGVDLYIQGNQVTNLSIDNVSVKEVQGFASPSLDSPMGAFKLVEGINTGGHLLQKVSSTSNGVIHTASVFVKYAGREWLRFTDAQSSNRVHFNTLTGLFGVVSGSVISYDSEALADGWYRLNIITTTVAAAYALRISLAEADNDVSYTGDGTSGIYIYGAQLEALPYATSYIPTSGSTVTRVQDVATDFGDVNTFNSEEGVLFVEMAALSDDLTQRFVAVSNGTSNNRLILGYDSFSNRVISFARVNGSLSFDIKVVITDIQNYNKLALRWKENDFSLWCNGLKIGEDLSGSSFPIGILDSFKFSDADGTTEIFKGKTKQVQVYKEALTDAQLITLTTI